MKRVFLTGLSLLALAGSVYSQQVVKQVGENQTALPSQTEPAQKATILQVGTSPTGNYGNLGVINQQSGSQTAQIEQSGGELGNSRSNRASITQSAVTLPTDGLPADATNTATIEQNNNSGGGSLVVTQTTTANEVRMAEGNWATIVQNGAALKAFIGQNNGSQGNSAILLQNGVGSEASILQVTASRHNAAVILQGHTTDNLAAGAANASLASISQNKGSEGNRAQIQQLNGSDNKSSIEQNGGAAGLSGGVSTGFANEVLPADKGNNASTLQQGTNNEATILQNNASTRNRADAAQYGRSNTIVLSQSDKSNNNQVSVWQGTPDKPGSVSNQATVLQDGTVRAAQFNQVTVRQLTEQNTAVVHQEGAGGAGFQLRNEVDQWAVGSGNLIDIEQNKNSGVVVDQRAADTGVSEANYARIRQGGGGFTAINQSAEGGMNSRNNASWVRQDGKNGSQPGAYLTQNRGSDNRAFAVQTGAGGIISLLQQWSNANVADMSQGTGGLNDVTLVRQINTSNSRITTRQNTSGSGMGNEIYAEQYYVNMPSRENQLLVQQDGTWNITRVVQTGVGGYVDVAQEGVGNVVQGHGIDGGTSWFDYASQASNPGGLGNTLRISQQSVSIGNVANIQQAGNASDITIRQVGL